MIHSLLDRVLIQERDKPFRLVFVLILVNLVAGVAIGIVPLDPLILWACFLVVGIVVVLVLPILFLLRKGKTLFQPLTVFIIIASGYVFSAVFLLFGGTSNSFQYTLNDENLIFFVQALGIILIGILSFIVAYLLVLVKGDDEEKSATAVSSSAGLIIAVALLSIFGLIGYYLFVSSSGGLVFLLTNIYGRTAFRSSEYYRVLFRYLQVASWIWFVYDRDSIKKVGFWAHILLNLLLLLSLGSRGPVILYVISFIFLHFLREKRVTPSSLSLQLARRIVGAGLFVIFASSVMFGGLAWRNASIAARSSRQGISAQLFTQQLSTYLEVDLFLSTTFGQANLASMEAVAMIVEFVPDKVPLLYGKTIYWIFLLPIPRAIWPDKPVITTGLYIKRAFFDSNAAGGVPPSWIGELYLNWHVIGVVLGCLLFGGASAAVYRAYRRNLYAPLFQLSYMVYTVYFMYLLTKGEFKTAVNITIMLFIPILFAHVLIQMFSSSRRQ